MPESTGSVADSSTARYRWLRREKPYILWKELQHLPSSLCCEEPSRGGAKGKPVCCQVTKGPESWSRGVRHEKTYSELS